MKSLAPWLLLLLAMAGGAGGTYVACPGCIARDRTNKSCEWTGDSVFPINGHSRAHQEHLVEDAQLAEELAISYADAEFKRRFGYEAHGGLIDDGRFRGECLSRMLGAIEKNHEVTSEQVRVARGQRNGTFDLAVVLLFLPIYSLGATMICRWLSRRFWSHERYVGLIATGLASVAVSFLGTRCLRMWMGVWEVIRVGNGHMSSMRAASYSRWTQEYAAADFIAGIVLFWIVALICYRFMAGQTHATDVRGQRGVLLR